MNKTLTQAIAVVAILIIGFLIINTSGGVKDNNSQARNYKDATFIIDGEFISLKDGVVENQVASGSPVVNSARYFGNESYADFNGDGGKDVVFLVTRQTGGTGIFYYVVAALDTENGYIGSQAFFLGDRIAPQTIEIGSDNVVIVNYADRAPGESFSVQPSLGKSLRLALDIKTMKFDEIIPDTEDGNNSSILKIDMKPWTLISAMYDGVTTLVPKKPNTFTLKFQSDGTFAATTDCNTVSGSYVVGEGSIVLNDMVSTKMYCEGSQEEDFIKLLQDTEGFHFTSQGELILDLTSDKGFITLR